MLLLKHSTAMLCIAISFYSSHIAAQDASPHEQDLGLSPQTIELLRTEMQALLIGVQTLSAGITTGNWKNVADTSAQINASYILDQKLSPAQREELDLLPEYFKKLDADFHAEAKKLNLAATNHDAQLVTFHYYRLIETCTVCHAAFAPHKFPGFSATTKPGHAH